MKIFIFLFVILAFFAYAEANDCKIDGRTLKIGETYSKPGACQLVECTGKNAVIAKGCPSEHALKPCKYIPQDNSKSYPQCCPRFIC